MPKRKTLENVSTKDVNTMSVEELNSMLDKKYKEDYEEYKKALAIYEEAEKNKDWLDKAEPYTDAIDYASSVVGTALNSTVVGAPIGSLIKATGSAPNQIIDYLQLGRDIVNHINNPTKENYSKVIENVPDIAASVVGQFDPTSISKTVYYTGKYGNKLFNSGKPERPVKYSGQDYYNYIHNVVPSDNTKIRVPIRLETVKGIKRK